MPWLPDLFWGEDSSAGNNGENNSAYLEVFNKVGRIVSTSYKWFRELLKIVDANSYSCCWHMVSAVGCAV